MSKLSSSEVKNESDNFLLYIPIIKHDLYEVRKGNVYLIFIHDKPLEKVLRWLVKKPYKSEVQLDIIGSEVWLLIDGKSNIHDIGRMLFKKFGDDCYPIYDRLILYLKYLNKKGWISFKKDETISL